MVEIDLFQLSAIIATWLALIVGILAYIKRHRTKSLSYEWVSTIPLILFRKEIVSAVKITYNGKEVQGAAVSLFKFTNGNVELLKSDFQKPFSIIFQSGIKVLDAEILDSKPENLQISLTTNENSVSFQPELINPKESFTIKVITNNTFDSVNLEHRIIGISQLKEVNRGNLMLNAMIVLLILSFGLVFLGGYDYKTNNETLSILTLLGFFGFIGIVSIGFFAVAILVGIYYQNFQKRKKSSFDPKKTKVTYRKRLA